MILKEGDGRRRIISIVDGKLKTSVQKFERLLGLDNPKNYRNMLSILKKAGKVKNERDFLFRAELMVPKPHVEALRAVIASKLNNPAFGTPASVRLVSGADTQNGPATTASISKSEVKADNVQV